MSSPTASSPALPNPGGHPLQTATYVLKSDLAQYCLPKANYDPIRKYAWANSICAVTLLIGLVGFYVPQMVERQHEDLTEIIPVVFTPPVEPPKVVESVQEEHTDEPAETVVEQVQVATVVAADPSAALFAVPVTGPVVFAPVSRAQAPPAVVRRASGPPKPVVFTGMGKEGYPTPPYPALAYKQKKTGSLTLYVVVGEDGVATEVKVQDGSGHYELDSHSVRWIKNQWHWPAGGIRHFLIPVEYELK